METDRTFQIDIGSETDRLFDDSSLTHKDRPKASILMGGVATGKTRLRAENYSQGFVLIDAAEMFHHLSGDAMLGFPDAFLEPLELIGRLVSRRAISERRNIVSEIIGAEADRTTELISALIAAGYLVDVVSVTCDFEESVRRNENRGDNISAYYAESFQRRWIIDACEEFSNASVAHQKSEQAEVDPVREHLSEEWAVKDLMRRHPNISLERATVLIREADEY